MAPRKHSNGRLEAKARSIRRKRPFVGAAVASAIHYLCLLGTATCAVMFVLEPRPYTMRALLASVGAAMVTWLIAYFKRRAAVCPLCKGTPLLHSGALPHAKAVRVRPFNHGVSAVMSTIVSQQFTCMYCGCRFDLLKAPTSQTYTDEDRTALGDVGEAGCRTPLTRLPARLHAARPSSTPPLAPIHASVHHPPQSF